MCGRFSILTYDEIEDVVRSVEANLQPNVLPDWPATRPSAYPGSKVSAIVQDSTVLARQPLEPQGTRKQRDLQGPRLAVAQFTWGFQFPWQKNTVFNTRIESALAGDVWKNAIDHGRCVVATAGFFEPHQREKTASLRTGKPVKRAYTFARPDRRPTLLAAVAEGAQLSIVTTAPNAFVSPIHNRMPLVLDPGEVATWFGEGYAALADRSGIELAVAPEDGLPAGEEGAREASEQARALYREWQRAERGSAAGGARAAGGASDRPDQLSLF